MITLILGWLIDVKTQLQSIDLAQMLGVQWVGANLTMWDVICVMFFCGTLLTIFFPKANEAEVSDAANWDDYAYDSEDLWDD